MSLPRARTECVPIRALTLLAVARSVKLSEVSGELELPYVSEDVEDSAYEMKLTAKEPGDDSHKKAIRYLTKELPALKEALKVFTKEIYAK